MVSYHSNQPSFYPQIRYIFTLIMHSISLTTVNNSDPGIIKKCVCVYVCVICLRVVVFFVCVGGGAGGGALC